MQATEELVTESHDPANQAAFFGATLAETDHVLARSIQDELHRQQHRIELIASENIVSRAVLEAQGSVLTNKYAEGYPARRYYGGCEYVDVAESLAIARARELFDCAFANVQPHSGAQANQCVMLALLAPGDTILGMSLAAGGHLTHGAAPNLSGKWFNAVQYGVRREDGRIDYDEVAALAREHRPRLIIAGGSAYPRIIDFERFRAIADEVGAWLHVDMAHFAGLVAAGVHPSPLPHAHVVTSTTHKTLRGPRGGLILGNDEALGRKINSAAFPGLQGGPLMHVIAGKAAAFGEALKPAYKGVCATGRGQRPGARGLAARPRLRHRLRRHRHAPHAGGSAAQGPHREGGGGKPRPGRHHLQQERRPLRHGEAHHHLGDPPRQPRGHHPGIRRRGVQGGRRPDRRVLEGLARHPGDNTAAETEALHRAETLCRRFPIYPGMNVRGPAA